MTDQIDSVEVIEEADLSLTEVLTASSTVTTDSKEELIVASIEEMTAALIVVMTVALTEDGVLAGAMAAVTPAVTANEDRWMT